MSTVKSPFDEPTFDSTAFQGSRLHDKSRFKDVTENKVEQSRLYCTFLIKVVAVDGNTNKSFSFLKSLSSRV